LKAANIDRSIFMDVEVEVVNGNLDVREEESAGAAAASAAGGEAQAEELREEDMEEEEEELREEDDDDDDEPQEEGAGQYEADESISPADFVKMQPADLLLAFEVMYNELINAAPRTSTNFGMYALRYFNVHRERLEDVNLNSLRTGYVDRAKSLNQLVYYMDKYEMLSGVSEGVDSTELRKKLAHYRVFVGQMYSAACAVVGCLVRRSSSDAKLEFEKDTTKYPFLNYGEHELSRMKTGSQLILFFLNKAFMHGLRKENGMVYEQKFIGTTPTHAWSPLYPMRTFIHTMAPKEIHYDVWEMLHGDGGSKVFQIETYLTDCTDFEFPSIKRERKYISFQNGVYFVYEDRFLPYGDPGLGGDVVSCNLHNKEMRAEWFQPPYLDDPLRIATPNLDRILHEQGFVIGDKPYQWILAWVLGRPLYDMGVVEKHHRNGVFLLGHAGSGKSTLAKIVEAYYTPDDTGHLNSECEAKYALAALVGKYVWFCLEVKKNFQLDMGMLLQMLEGMQRISIQKKNVTAWAEEWNIPGLMAGNELPQKWVDGGAGNSLVRRMFVIEFPNKPPRLDSNLFSRLLRELPAIMVKSNRLYRRIASEVGIDGDIDEHLPTYFKDTLLRFQTRTQPLIHMVQTNHELTSEFPEGKIHIQDLKSIFLQWAKVNGGGRAVCPDDDEIARQMKSIGYTIKVFKKSAPVDYRGKKMSGTFIMGLASKAEMDAQQMAGAGGGAGHSSSTSLSGVSPTIETSSVDFFV
jgi:energy-coupling factor transporter ATP-binding protein EcfA2